jgi:hypothetical protein
MRQERRLDISWSGNEIHDYEDLKQGRVESRNPARMFSIYADHASSR